MIRIAVILIMLVSGAFSSAQTSNNWGFIANVKYMSTDRDSDFYVGLGVEKRVLSNLYLGYEIFIPIQAETEKYIDDTYYIHQHNGAFVAYRFNLNNQLFITPKVLAGVADYTEMMVDFDVIGVMDQPMIFLEINTGVSYYIHHQSYITGSISVMATGTVKFFPGASLSYTLGF